MEAPEDVPLRRNDTEISGCLAFDGGHHYIEGPQYTMLDDIAIKKGLRANKKRASRPNLHITSPSGWLNDPCAPCYDPNTGLYHLFYQCNPNGVEWGDMSWGHATSQDLLRWTFEQQHTKLEPDRDYDNSGVFTGCMAPLDSDSSASTDNNGDRTMTIFYTSINMLPFHWTNPAPRGSAGLSMATSTDGGKTWTKSDMNPILEEEPKGLNVTGFRDPFLAEWDAMDKVRGKKSLYGLISGGIVRQKYESSLEEAEGPTTFIYAVDPEKLSQWEYLGPLVDMPSRFQPCGKWNCNYGVNWECVNFMTLRNQVSEASGGSTVSRNFLILGSEGDMQREHLTGSHSSSLPSTSLSKEHQTRLSPNLPPRAVRAQQWMAGDLAVKKHLPTSASEQTVGSDAVRMEYQYGGILDHGVYYAANSFFDTRTQRQIVYGWIPEEDCSINFVREKGWNGCQALPRELFLQSTINVVGAIRSSLEDIGSVELEQQDDGAYTVHTLGIRPLSEFRELETMALARTEVDSFTLSPSESQLESSGSQSTRSRTTPARPEEEQHTVTKHITTVTHPTWSLKSTVSLPSSCFSFPSSSSTRSEARSKIKSLGFNIRSSQEDHSKHPIRTTIFFNPSDEVITVDRSKSIPPPSSSSSSPWSCSSSISASTATSASSSTPAPNPTNAQFSYSGEGRPLPKEKNFDFHTQSEQGPFTLFRFQPSISNSKSTSTSPSTSTDANPEINTKGEEEKEEEQEEFEKLNLRIISDGHILEIFANDRFALATMVYTPHADSGDDDDVPTRYGGIEAFVEYHATNADDGYDEEEEGKERVVFENLKVFDGLGAGENFIVG